jgi:hypothetical protein
MNQPAPTAVRERRGRSASQPAVPVPPGDRPRPLKTAWAPPPRSSVPPSFGDEFGDHLRIVTLRPEYLGRLVREIVRAGWLPADAHDDVIMPAAGRRPALTGTILDDAAWSLTVLGHSRLDLSPSGAGDQVHSFVRGLIPELWVSSDGVWVVIAEAAAATWVLRFQIAISRLTTPGATALAAPTLRWLGHDEVFPFPRRTITWSPPGSSPDRCT